MYKSLVHIQFSRTRDRWSSHFGVLHFLLHALIDLWDPKTPQKYEKSSKIDCFLVVMVTDFIYYFIFLFILIGLGSPIILVYYTTFYMHSLIRETQRTLKNGRNGCYACLGYHGYRCHHGNQKYPILDDFAHFWGFMESHASMSAYKRSCNTPKCPDNQALSGPK